MESKYYYAWTKKMQAYSRGRYKAGDEAHSAILALTPARLEYWRKIGYVSRRRIKNGGNANGEEKT